MKTLSIGTEITADSRGQIITGKVEKINRTTCLITVTGGNTRFKIGGKVKCPFSIITVPFKCGDRGIELTNFVASGSVIAPTSKPPFVADKWWVRSNANLLVLLGAVFSDLSPENLSCDGEASAAWINRRRREINARYTNICNLIGRDIDETEYYDIMEKWWKDISEDLMEDAKNIESWHKRSDPVEREKIDACNGV
jgi:hypothetical protein